MLEREEAKVRRQKRNAPVAFVSFLMSYSSGFNGSDCRVWGREGDWRAAFGTAVFAGAEVVAAYTAYHVFCRETRNP